MSSHFLQSTPEISASTWFAPRSGQPDFLDRLSRGLIRASSVREIGDFVTTLLLENTAAESCSLLLLDEITGVLEVVGIETETTVESRPSLMDSFMSPDGGQGVAAWVASQCVPVRLEEASKDERFALAGGPGGVVNSLISFPLETAGRVVGVINLSSPAPGVFSDLDERAVSIAAEHIAPALDRARRFDEINLERTNLNEQVEDYQRRLAQSDKMSAVGRLLAGIVHELNNPLTTILGFAQLLARTDGGNKKNLSRIVSETERCARIVQNVLRISRPGKADNETIDLNSTVRETLELAAYQLRLNKVSLGLNLAAKSPAISVNPCEFTQVLLNIVTNAVQAIGEDRDEGSVDVSTETLGDRVLIRIRDNGPGLPEGDISKIFEPFFTTKETGTGLGLSLSRQLVESNQGEISVVSDEGQGTTFTLSFPVTEGDPDPEVGDKRPPRVLVADDEHHILDLVDAVLSDTDYEVECVGSGEEAIAKLQASEFDLVISDLRMPGIGGREVVEWIQSEGKNAEVLLLTGDVASREMKDFISRSGISCLSKPFRIGELVEAVETALGDSAAASKGSESWK